MLCAGLLSIIADAMWSGKNKADHRDFRRSIYGTFACNGEGYKKLSTIIIYIYGVPFVPKLNKIV